MQNLCINVALVSVMWMKNIDIILTGGIIYEVICSCVNPFNKSLANIIKEKINERINKKDWSMTLCKKETKNQF